MSRVAIIVTHRIGGVLLTFLIRSALRWGLFVALWSFRRKKKKKKRVGHGGDGGGVGENDGIVDRIEEVRWRKNRRRWFGRTISLLFRRWRRRRRWSTEDDERDDLVRIMLRPAAASSSSSSSSCGTPTKDAANGSAADPCSLTTAEAAATTSSVVTVAVERLLIRSAGFVVLPSYVENDDDDDDNDNDVVGGGDRRRRCVLGVDIGGVDVAIRFVVPSFCSSDENGRATTTPVVFLAVRFSLDSFRLALFPLGKKHHRRSTEEEDLAPTTTTTTSSGKKHLETMAKAEGCRSPQLLPSIVGRCDVAGLKWSVVTSSFTTTAAATAVSTNAVASSSPSPSSGGGGASRHERKPSSDGAVFVDCLDGNDDDENDVGGDEDGDDDYDVEVAKLRCCLDRACVIPSSPSSSLSSNNNGNGDDARGANAADDAAAAGDVHRVDSPSSSSSSSSSSVSLRGLRFEVLRSNNGGGRDDCVAVGRGGERRIGGSIDSDHDSNDRDSSDDDDGAIVLASATVPSVVLSAVSLPPISNGDGDSSGRGNRDEKVHDEEEEEVPPSLSPILSAPHRMKRPNDWSLRIRGSNGDGDGDKYGDGGALDDGDGIDRDGDPVQVHVAAVLMHEEEQSGAVGADAQAPRDVGDRLKSAVDALKGVVLGNASSSERKKRARTRKNPMLGGEVDAAFVVRIDTYVRIDRCNVGDSRGGDGEVCRATTDDDEAQRVGGLCLPPASHRRRLRILAGAALVARRGARAFDSSSAAPLAASDDKEYADISSGTLMEKASDPLDSTEETINGETSAAANTTSPQSCPSSLAAVNVRRMKVSLLDNGPLGTKSGGTMTMSIQGSGAMMARLPSAPKVGTVSEGKADAPAIVFRASSSRLDASASFVPVLNLLPRRIRTRTDEEEKDSDPGVEGGWRTPEVAELTTLEASFVGPVLRASFPVSNQNAGSGRAETAAVRLSVKEVEMRERHYSDTDRCDDSHGVDDSDAATTTVFRSTGNAISASIKRQPLCLGDFSNVQFEVSRTVDAFVSGPVVMVTWSPQLQMSAVYAVRRSLDAKALFLRLASSRRKKLKKTCEGTVSKFHFGMGPSTCVRMTATVGGAGLPLQPPSVLTMDTCSVAVDATATRVAGFGVTGEPGDTMHLRMGKITVYLGEKWAEKAKEEVLVLDHWTVRRSIRHATNGEVASFVRREGSASDLVVSAAGRPLREVVDLALGAVTMRAPPDLFVGKVIDDLSITPKAVEQALIAAGLKRSPPRKRQRRHFLSRIILGVSHLDVSLLEMDETESAGHLREPRLINVLRLRATTIALTLDRDFPRDAVQVMLRDLDEDKTRKHVYGPAVLGGRLALSIGHSVCVLHPLTLATPVASVRRCKVTGMVFLAGLSPNSDGVHGGKEVDLFLPCHHLPHGSCECCIRQLQTRSTGIPPKVYIDVTTSSSSVDAAYGPVLVTSIPRLMGIVKRLTPPPPPMTKSGTSPPPLPWWDNIRFWVHGRVDLSLDSLSLRWLLDTEDRHDWSIQLTCRAGSIRHITGAVLCGMEEVVVSVPGSSYDFFIDEDEHEVDYIAELLCEANAVTTTGGRRHSLLLVPSLRLDVAFEWVIPGTGEGRSSGHHCVYCSYDPVGDSLVSKEGIFPHLPDKFHDFRSSGVDVTLDLSLNTVESGTNWVALRIDVLPWLTHKNIAIPSPPPSSDASQEPLPRLNNLTVDAKMKDLRVAMWFDDAFLNESSSELETEAPIDGLYLVVPSITFTKNRSSGQKVNIGGKIKAASLALTGLKYRNDMDSVRRNIIDDIEMEAIDRSTGLFGSLVEENTEAEEVMYQYHAAFSLGGSRRESALAIFELLKDLSRSITEFDYLFILEQVDIIDTPLEDLVSSPTSDKEIEKNQATQHNEQGTWTVLLSRLKLLWTLTIRDALTSTIQDLIHTVGFMKGQVRRGGQIMPEQKMMEREEKMSNDECDRSVFEDDELSTDEGASWKDEVVSGDNDIEVSQRELHSSDMQAVRRSPRSNSDNDRKAPKSSLAYLLRSRSSIAGVFRDEASSPLMNLVRTRKEKAKALLHMRTSQGLKRKTDSLMGSRASDMSLVSDQLSEPDLLSSKRLETVPTFDIHLSNPQIQLHSKSTGGSVVLGIEGAYVEGRKFVHLLASNREHILNDKILPEDLLRKTSLHYTLSNMEGYALSTDVDVGAEIQWLEVSSSGCLDGIGRQGGTKREPEMNSRPQPNGLERLFLRDEDAETKESGSDFRQRVQARRVFPAHLKQHEIAPFKSHGLLKKILNRCTFETSQVFHRPPIDMNKKELKASIKEGLVLPLIGNVHASGVPENGSADQPVLDHVQLQLDELDFMLDSYQFGTTIDVVRNVLLEPPKPARSWKYATQSKEDSDSVQISREPLSQEDGEEEEEDIPSSVNIMEQVLRKWRQSVSKDYRGKKGREALRSAAQRLLFDLEDRVIVEDDIVSRRVDYSLNKLKWSIQSPEYLDAVSITFTNFYGQHDFSTVGVVVTQLSLEDVRVSSEKPGPDSINFFDPTAVITSAIGTERSACENCGFGFDRATNESDSCKFHPGEFIQDTWSCCGENWEGVQGCASRPHKGKETFAAIRVEALPPVIDGMRLYKHLEVNIYPSVSHTIVVQITKTLAQLFMAYFLGDGGDGGSKNQTDIAITRSASHEEESSISTTSESVSSALLPSETGRTPSSALKTHSKKSALLGSQRKLRKARSEPSIDVARESQTDEDKSSISPDGHATLEVERMSQEEIIFVKHWRVGYINVDVSIAGFKRIPDTSGITILVPAFAKAYKIGTKKYLGRKYVSHLIHEVLKSAASSGLVKVKQRLLGHAKDIKGRVDYNKLSSVHSSTHETEDSPTKSDHPVGRTDFSFAGGEENARAKLFLGTPATTKASKRSKHQR